MKYQLTLLLILCAAFLAPAESLPQLQLTYSGTLSKNMKSYISGSMILTDSDGTVYDIPNVLIKTRGATASAYVNKPALNIKLRDDNGEELDTDLLGLRKASSFILDAMAIDRINMRNRVAFDIWNAFSRLPYETDFGSRNGTVGRFVEVFLNGKYKGIYCLSDKINRKLLDLKKPQVDEETGDVTIRGVLYKNGTNDVGNQNTAGFFNDFGVYVARYHDAWELHEPEDYASEEVWGPLVALYNGHTSDYSYIKDHFWIENLADYTIHVMALCIQDNWGAKNRYFSIQNITKDDDRGRFIITPWDLDASLGGSYNGSRFGGNYSNWAIGDISKNPPIPITGCMGQEEFKSLLRKRWIEGSAGPFAVDSVSQRLNDYADLFIESGAWQRTVDAHNSDDMIVQDLKQEIELIVEWYANRFQQMDAYFGVTDADRDALASLPSILPDPNDPSSQHPNNPTTQLIYNLQGIPVSGPLSPGIYIRNGRKFRIP